MVKTYWHIYAVCVAVLLAGLAAVVAYVDIFQPGTFAVASIVSIPVMLYPILQGQVVKLYKSVEPYLADIMRFFDKHIVRTTVVSIVVALVSAIGIVIMLQSFTDKLRYVGVIRETVMSQLKATAPVPDPKLLADAFRLFPERSEVPLLLTRTSRTFSHSDNWLKFIQYQGTFLEELTDLVEGSALCSVSADGFDPVIFVAVTNVEASVGATELAQRLSDLDTASEASIALLDRCETTPERAIVSLLLKDTVNDISPDRYDIDVLSKEVSAQLDSLDPAAAARVSRAHSYQQYLDFLAYRHVNALHANFKEPDPAKKLSDDETATMTAAIMRHYRTILSLRSVVGSSGEVLWFTTPGKLNLNRLFMERGGFSNSVNAQFTQRVSELTDLAEEINTLIDAPAFRSFQTPAVWFKATPLDLSLEGSKLKSLTDATLKDGW